MYSAKQMIVVRKDLNMRKGKIAAQSAHASLNAVLSALIKENRLSDIDYANGHIYLKPSKKQTTPLSEWFENGTAKICVYVNSEKELLEIDKKAKEAGIISSLICDAGYTEFHGQPTYTALALEPALPEIVDKITGNLPLY